MLSELLRRVSLFHLLHRIDQDLAAKQQLARCPFCGGPLHKAPYVRKPRGGPEDVPEEFRLRLSLCCGRQSCRRRVLPSSCLFMGRRVYWGCVIVVVMALRQQAARSSSKVSLMRRFGVSRQSISRWVGYFREIFPKSNQWQRLRGLVAASVRDQELPNSLLAFFQQHHQTESALVGCLRFLATGFIS